MRKRNQSMILFTLLFLFVTSESSVFALDFDEIDSLIDIRRFYSAQRILRTWLDRDLDRETEAKVYRYLARMEREIGDDRERTGIQPEELLDIFQKGLEIIEQSIELNPRDGETYFWRAALIGRWAQTKGILDALNRAGDMQENLVRAIELAPDYAPSYMVMGQLYVELPGWPLSFGDREKGIGFYRKCLVTPSESSSLAVDIRLRLAEALIDRNWDVEQRTNEQRWKREQFANFSSSWERFGFFEGTIGLSRQSDRDEARRLLDEAERLYNQIPDEQRNPDTPAEIRNLKERL